MYRIRMTILRPYNPPHPHRRVCLPYSTAVRMSENALRRVSARPGVSPVPNGVSGKHLLFQPQRVLVTAEAAQGGLQRAGTAVRPGPAEVKPTRSRRLLQIQAGENAKLIQCEVEAGVVKFYSSSSSTARKVGYWSSLDRSTSVQCHHGM